MANVKTGFQSALKSRLSLQILIAREAGSLLRFNPL